MEIVDVKIDLELWNKDHREKSVAIYENKKHFNIKQQKRSEFQDTRLSKIREHYPEVDDSQVSFLPLKYHGECFHSKYNIHKNIQRDVTCGKGTNRCSTLSQRSSIHSKGSQVGLVTVQPRKLTAISNGGWAAEPIPQELQNLARVTCPRNDNNFFVMIKPPLSHKLVLLQYKTLYSVNTERRFLDIVHLSANTIFPKRKQWNPDYLLRVFTSPILEISCPRYTERFRVSGNLMGAGEVATRLALHPIEMMRPKTAFCTSLYFHRTFCWSFLYGDGTTETTSPVMLSHSSERSQR
ncbi:hypothetical protein WN51_06699 [Melipona quadrifasciata]|uniref:Uncharacterized protein n=1 Tax=Melipona quadrifasciata TaxID=166423 RepID=A0A0M9AAA1_9HYME|nr:hypothetical protein WN51_06699 [Melipona quadrifasciata]